MKKFKRSIVLNSLLLIFALVPTLLWLIDQKFNLFHSKIDQFVQDKALIQSLLKNSSEIHQLWNQGEDSKEWPLIKEKCLKHFNIDSSFDESLLRCNPLLLLCNDLFNSKLNYQLSSFDQSDQKYRYLSKSHSFHIGIKDSGYLFTIEDKLTKKKLNLFLTDQCHEVYLPNRRYAYGEEMTGDAATDFYFDNFNRHIYIDRHLVLNFEINEWIKFSKQKSINGLAKVVGNDLFKPATNLTYNQMEDYCGYKGKQLMLAHFFDAATFLPIDQNDSNPKKIHRSPYYWTKKKTEFKADCSYLLAEECLSLKDNQDNLKNPTWAGLVDTMGGPLEVFRNPIDPDSNLKASSYYFNFKSSWHRLGVRAYWDGEGHDLRHFDFKGLNPALSVDKFKVGFRCLRESR